MAYNNTQHSGQNQKSNTASATARKAIYRTGLFAPNKPGVKSLGSVQLKEDVTLPAGSYINLYEVDNRKSDASPVFTISVTEGKLGNKSGAAGGARPAMVRK